jgi:uncharacterized membrane protein (UPF0127 family)
VQRVNVTIEDRTRSLGHAIEIADTSFRRMKGLLGRKGLAAGGGLWIKPSSGVHTLFMSFAIDVVGLDKQYRVVHLWRGLLPWRITRVSLAVRTVLELPAGTISGTSLQVGERLAICPVEEAA